MPRWEPERVRYAGKVQRGNGCWEWVGAKSSTGYGNFYTRGKMYLTHRYAWEEEHGAIPLGLCVLHLCDNRACVRPDHLFLGTKKTNSLDMVGKGRAHMPDSAGEKHGLSKLTDAAVVDVRRRFSAGELGKDLAAEYGVSPSLVSLVVRRKAWVHI